VILYDLGEVKPFKTTGYHSLKASGTSRNSDNSVDNKSQVPAMCTKVDVNPPTEAPTEAPSETPITAETPFESFQGITFDPSGTPPPTGTAGVPARPDQGVPTVPLALLLGSCLASVFVFKTIKVTR
jgi:hypothetical protein